MTVTDYVLSSIEKTFLKNPAIYSYIEVVPKTFLATAGVQSWRQEDVFAKEPVRRMIVAMSINEAYLGTNRTNPFHYQKFGLNEIIVYRNGLPVAGSPILTSDNKRIYYKSLEALDFVLNTSHGISLANYDNHYIMPLDLRTFSGHYRQRGSGFCALTLGIGRVAVRLARKFVIPAAKKIGKELLLHAAPELIEVATKRKSRSRHSKARSEKPSKSK